MEPVLSNNLIIMEWVGLKDYKGKDIYEADILEHPTGERFIVKWKANCVGFKAIYRDELDSNICLQVAGKGQAIVIGNKFQNLDLWCLG